MRVLSRYSAFAAIPAATTFILFLTLAPLDSAAQLGPQFGAAVDVAGGQLFVGEGRNLLQPGSVFVFDQTADGSWAETERLMVASIDSPADGFGRSLSADGMWLAVGASDAETVTIYRKSDSGSWTEHMRLVHDEPGFGSNVVLDVPHLLVTAEGNADTASSVHAYRLEGQDWMPYGEFKAEDREARDQFGAEVIVVGARAFIGAPASGEGRGHVYDFRWTGNKWAFNRALQPQRGATGDQFGSALAWSDGILMVGAPGANGRLGGVHRIDLSDDEPSFGSILQAPMGTENEQFGAALAWNASSLLVGAPGHDMQSGAVYTFDLQDNNWQGVRMDAPDFLQYRSGYGSVLAADGAVAVSAPGHDNFEGVVYTLSWTDGAVGHVGPIYSDSGVFASVTGGAITCTEQQAGGFPCDEVDMVSFLSRSDIGARRGMQVSDVWGWTDPDTGHEIAIVGRTDGTSFIDLTDANNPVYLGDLPMTATANQSLWRDIKTYQNYAYIVADGAGAHHVQIFDLTQLRDLTDVPVTFTETNLYKGVYSAHNIVINEESGFAYAVGADSGGEACGGALHMMDLSDPVNPTFAGCFNDSRTGRSGSGATHDAQCVIYRGPDTDYSGAEICLSSNGTALSIADVTDKSNPKAISIAEYPAVAYTHQGWLTEDHRYFYLNDEGDEASGLVDATRTLILDVTDLDEPVMAGEYLADDNAIDHNLYVKGNVMYQTNYVSGLRLLDVSNPESPVEIGHFDTVPYGPNDNSPVLGAWSSYPYFESGVIVVTSGREGVFFLKQKTVDL